MTGDGKSELFKKKKKKEGITLFIFKITQCTHFQEYFERLARANQNIPITGAYIKELLLINTSY